MHFKHVETAEDYRYQLPFEADKSKSIAEMTLDELRRLNQRLSLERETQGIILDLRRNSGERYDYDHPPRIDTVTPVEQLYHDAELTHHGVLGMKWGVRKDRGSNVTKSAAQKRPPSDDYVQSRQLKSRGSKALTSKELKDLTNRLQLERQYNQLTKESSNYQKGMNFVKGLMTAGTTVTSLYALSKTPLAQDVAKLVKSKLSS